MNCPTANEWALLAMEAVEGVQAESMLAHARICPACREQLEAARRGHIDRVRMYEAFDRGHDELREQLMAALPAEPPGRGGASRLVRGCYRLGDYVMSLNTSRGRRAAAILAPAACITIAVVLFLYVGERSAFATALEHLRSAKTIVCRITIPGGVEIQGMDVKAEGKMWVSAEHGSRVEMYVNGSLSQLQHTPLEGPTILVSPQSRSYMELDLSEMAPDQTATRTPNAWLEKLKELEAEADRELGYDTVDGREVTGFEISGERLGFASPAGADAPGAFMQMWVDIQTGLPVQMKTSVPMPGPDGPMTVVMDQFEWDAPVDASLFAPDLPPEYVKLDVKFARPSEETLLLALNKIRELTGGRYTSTLQSVSALAEIAGLLTDSAKTKVEALDQQGIMQMALEIASGCNYFGQLLREGREPEYFGNSVTADDEDQVLLRWKLEDGSTRVIYGDLRIETVPGPE